MSTMSTPKRSSRPLQHDSLAIMRAVAAHANPTRQQICEALARAGVEIAHMGSKLGNMVAAGHLLTDLSARPVHYSLSSPAAARMAAEGASVAVMAAPPARRTRRQVPLSATGDRTGSRRGGDYVPTVPPVRPGADDFLAIPSRFGNRLRYRDGRVAEITP